MCIFSHLCKQVYKKPDLQNSPGTTWEFLEVNKFVTRDLGRGKFSSDLKENSDRLRNFNIFKGSVLLVFEYLNR